MNANEIFPVIFDNNKYFLRLEQVEQLLLISQSCDFGTELIIKSKDGKEIKGQVVNFYGYNPLAPYEFIYQYHFH